MFLRGPVLSAEQVKNAFLGIDDSSTTLLSVFQEYKQHQKDMIGKCRSLSTYKRITLVYNRVTDFIKVKHHRSDMYAAEIDGSFVDDFSDYLFTTYKVSNNQVQKIMQVFKHVTKICIKKGLLKKDQFSDYKIKFDPVDPNFLTVDELKLIIQKKFSLRSLETTKDLFVFSCFTGLAFVDAMNLKRENITLAENGDMWIKITRQKTNIPSIRFDINNSQESQEQFKHRINRFISESEESTDDIDIIENDSARWTIGINNRSVGSIHTDMITTTAADLASCNLIAVFPVIGWWKLRGNLQKYNNRARYSLFASLDTPTTEVDLYNVVQTKIANIIQTPVEINIPV